MPIRESQKGQCPHCKTPNRFEAAISNQGLNMTSNLIIHDQNNRQVELRMCRCTNCGKVIIFFDDSMIYPIGASRPHCPQQVPEDIASDYTEACLVESYSKKAATALARRCLQNILHNQGIIKKNLNDEIDEAIKKLPTYLGRAIDAVRTIGNFATHPIKYEHTSEIVEVEEGEAEWTLNVLEQLFDFYYVAPDELEVKRQSLNVKLKAAGKPELK